MFPCTSLLICMLVMVVVVAVVELVLRLWSGGVIFVRNAKHRFYCDVPAGRL